MDRVRTTPCRHGEAPISTTQHDERQSLVSKRSKRRRSGPAQLGYHRAASNMHRGPGDRTPATAEAGSNLWRD